MGYFVFETGDLDLVKELMMINPVVLAGGSVEIHRLEED